MLRSRKSPLDELTHLIFGSKSLASCFSICTETLRLVRVKRHNEKTLPSDTAWILCCGRGPSFLFSAHSAEPDWCLEAGPSRRLSTSAACEARWNTAGGHQELLGFTWPVCPEPSRAGRMRLSRRVTVFAPEDKRKKHVTSSYRVSNTLYI